MTNYEKVILDVINILKSNKAIDEYSRYEMCNNLYTLLLQYFDSAKGNEALKAKEIELNAVKYAITSLIPILEILIEKCEEKYMHKYYEIWEKSYAFAGRRSLEHFIHYMEMDKAKKILPDRICVLKPFIFYLNKSMFDNNLKLVCASYSPSTGKSFCANYYSAWALGIKADGSILRISYSEELVLGFSRSIKEIIMNPRFSDVFPRFKIFGNKPFEKEKDSDWKIKNTETLKSHISRTRDGSTTGERAKTAIILDDILKGEGEATNDALHTSIYNKYMAEWLNRAEGEEVTFVALGTMWSPDDILNKLWNDEEKVQKILSSRQFKYVWETEKGNAVFIRVPALNENGYSTCPKVHPTEYYKKLEENLDPYFFSCVYQQSPIPPSGLEFANELIEHYEKLPKNENGDEICSNYCVAVLDPARKGKDNVSMPIFKTDGTYYYMIDCIFKQKPMTDLYDEIVDKIIEHNIINFVIENNTDTSLKSLLLERLKQKNYLFCEIREKYNTEKKEERIKNNRGIIKKFIVFKDSKTYSNNSDYGRFMKNLMTYSFDFANKHDDAPDSLALMSSEIILDKGRVAKAKAINRGELGI